MVKYTCSYCGKSYDTHEEALACSESHNTVKNTFNEDAEELKREWEEFCTFAELLEQNKGLYEENEKKFMDKYNNVSIFRKLDGTINIKPIKEKSYETINDTHSNAHNPVTKGIFESFKELTDKFWY